MLSEEGKSKAVAFDEIDKAPEEKARGITIATAHGGSIFFGVNSWGRDGAFGGIYKWSTEWASITGPRHLLLMRTGFRID